MNRVYIVSVGTYSDTDIVGVFSSEERANEVVKSFVLANGNENEIGIDEFGIDPSEMYYPVTRVEIDEYGNILDIRTNPVYQLVKYPETDRLDFFSIFHLCENSNIREIPVLVCFIKTSSHEKAIQVANERRNGYLNSGTWRNEN